MQLADNRYMMYTYLIIRYQGAFKLITTENFTCLSTKVYCSWAIDSQKNDKKYSNPSRITSTQFHRIICRYAGMCIYVSMRNM